MSVYIGPFFKGISFQERIIVRKVKGCAKCRLQHNTNYCHRCGESLVFFDKEEQFTVYDLREQLRDKLSSFNTDYDYNTREGIETWVGVSKDDSNNIYDNDYDAIIPITAIDTEEFATRFAFQLEILRANYK